VPKPEQVKTVIELSKGTEMEIPVLLGATTGGRRSEVSGLKWEDIDLKTGRLTIRRGLQWMPVGKDDKGSDPTRVADHRAKDQAGASLHAIVAPSWSSGYASTARIRWSAARRAGTSGTRPTETWSATAATVGSSTPITSRPPAA
jgi:integrase